MLQFLCCLYCLNVLLKSQITTDWWTANTVLYHSYIERRDKNNPGNYRSVSFTNVIGLWKIMVATVRKEFTGMSHMKEHNVFSNNQYRMDFDLVDCNRFTYQYLIYGQWMSPTALWFYKSMWSSRYHTKDRLRCLAMELKENHWPGSL